MAYPGLGLGPRRHMVSAHGHFFELAPPFLLFIFIFSFLETVQGRSREVVLPAAEGLDESALGGVCRGRGGPQSNA